MEAVLLTALPRRWVELLGRLPRLLLVFAERDILLVCLGIRNRGLTFSVLGLTGPTYAESRCSPYENPLCNRIHTSIGKIGRAHV